MDTPTLKEDLECPPCTIDVQIIKSINGNFLVIFLRDKEGKAVGHWIISKEHERDGLIEVLKKFEEMKVQ